MNLLRKTWVIAIAVMMGACHSETLDIVSPNGNLKITIEPSEKKRFGRNILLSSLQRKKHSFRIETGIGNRCTEAGWKSEAEGSIRIKTRD